MVVKDMDPALTIQREDSVSNTQLKPIRLLQVVHMQAEAEAEVVPELALLMVEMEAPVAAEVVVIATGEVDQMVQTALLILAEEVVEVVAHLHHRIVVVMVVPVAQAFA